MPSRFAMERARELIVIDKDQAVRVTVCGKAFVYQDAEAALKASDEMIVTLAEALDLFHQEMQVFSVWIPKPGDAS